MGRTAPLTPVTGAGPRPAADGGWRALLGITAALGVGFAGTAALPIVIGAIADRLALDESRVGLLGTLELGALAVSSLAIAPRVGRGSRATLAGAGATLAVLGHVLSASAGTWALLLVSRTIAGLGAGTAIAAATAAIAALPEPERVYARVAVVSGVAGALLLAVLPLAVAPWGYRGGYALLAVACGLGAPLVRWIPPAPGAAEAARREPGLPHLRLATMGLTSLLILAVGQNGLWAFSERIGVRVGLTGRAVGLALGGMLLLGLAGAGIAAGLGSRFGRSRPLATGIALIGLAAWVLSDAGSPTAYVAALLLWGVAFFFSMPYAMGAIAGLDVRGRWSAAAVGASTIGSALGPGAAGLVALRWSYPGVGLLMLLGAICSLALLLPVTLSLDTDALEGG